MGIRAIAALYEGAYPETAEEARHELTALMEDLVDVIPSHVDHLVSKLFYERILSDNFFECTRGMHARADSDPYVTIAAAEKLLELEASPEAEAIKATSKKIDEFALKSAAYFTRFGIDGMRQALHERYEAIRHEHDPFTFGQLAPLLTLEKEREARISARAHMTFCRIALVDEDGPALTPEQREARINAGREEVELRYYSDFAPFANIMKGGDPEAQKAALDRMPEGLLPPE